MSHRQQPPVASDKQTRHDFSCFVRTHRTRVANISHLRLSVHHLRLSVRDTTHGGHKSHLFAQNSNQWCATATGGSDRWFICAQRKSTTGVATLPNSPCLIFFIMNKPAKNFGSSVALYTKDISKSKQQQRRGVSGVVSEAARCPVAVSMPVSHAPPLLASVT